MSDASVNVNRIVTPKLRNIYLIDNDCGEKVLSLLVSGVVMLVNIKRETI